MHRSNPLSRRLLRSEVWSRGPRFPGFSVLPDDIPRVLRYGPDPVRVLIVGGGLGAGFGARNHEAGLTGRLCAALHDGLGRGVVVESRARPRIAVRDVPASVGAAGALTFDAVVYTPNLSSAVGGRAGRWERSAQAMVDHLRATGRPDLPIVLAGLPPFRFSGRHQQRVEEERLATVAAMQAFADRTPGVRFAPVTATPDLDVDTDYSRFHRAFAADVCRVLLPVLTTSARSTV